MGKWNEEAAPNNNMASEELAASNLISKNTVQAAANQSDTEKAKKSPGNRRTL